VSPLQPYTSKEEAQSATPDSWAGHAAKSGIIRPAIKSNAVNPSAWTTCRDWRQPGPRRSECHTRRIADVAARRGLLLHTDSHYVDSVSSRKRVPAPRGPAELGQLQDHYHQNDNDQDANNDPNDSSVHFSSFDSHAEVILATRSR
jgi:hypothetical protein